MHGRVFWMRLRNDGLAHRRMTTALRRLHDTPASNVTRTTANVYIDSVFPIRFANWDLRYIIAAFRQPRIMDELEDVLKNVAVHDFKLLRLEPPGCVTRFAASAVGFICLMVRQSEGWRCLCRVRVYSSFRS